MRGLCEVAYSVAAILLVAYGVMSFVAFTAKRAGTMTADNQISPDLPVGFVSGQLRVPVFVLRVLRPLRWPLAIVGVVAILLRVLL